MRSGRRMEAGVTLVELVLVVSLLGILAAVGSPRFFSSLRFQERFFAQDVAGALRYAQKLAVATGCDVEVSLGAGGYTLRQRAACRTGAFSQAVTDPADGAPSYAGAPPPGVALASTVSPLVFDPLGRARDAGAAVTDAVVTVGPVTLQVVGETGLVFDPAS